MLWVSHGVSEQNSRRAAHTAQPGSLTPPAIRTPPPTGTWPCLAMFVGHSWWGQLRIPLHLTHCCPACRSCRASGVPVAGLTQACEKAHAKRDGGVLWRRHGAFWLQGSHGCHVGPVRHRCSQSTMQHNLAQKCQIPGITVLSTTWKCSEHCCPGNTHKLNLL